MKKQDVIDQALKSALTYSDYMELIAKLHKEQKATSFSEDPSYFEYSRLGFSRMKRVYKQIILDENLIKQVSAIQNPQHWLLLTESWCGDASQTVPIIAKLAELNSQIDLRIVLRESNSELMDLYRTDGAKSIPKLALFDRSWHELGSWGPRPKEAQAMLNEYKAIPEAKRPPYAEFSEKMQRWYNEDQGESTQRELKEVLH